MSVPGVNCVYIYLPAVVGESSLDTKAFSGSQRTGINKPKYISQNQRDYRALERRTLSFYGGRLSSGLKQWFSRKILHQWAKRGASRSAIRLLWCLRHGCPGTLWAGMLVTVSPTRMFTRMFIVCPCGHVCPLSRSVVCFLGFHMHFQWVLLVQRQ
jgi:hypothetical protein